MSSDLEERADYERITWGAKNFRDVIAAKYEHFSGIKVDSESEIVVTCGSTDTILSGAEPIYVPLVPPDFTFSVEQLENAFKQGAKALILCNPLLKTYSITGWRLGYVIANPEIIDRVKKVHDFLTVGAAAPGSSFFREDVHNLI